MTDDDRVVGMHGMTFGALFCLVYLWCPAPQPRAAQLLLATDGTIWQIAAEQDQTLKAWRVPRALPT